MHGRAEEGELLSLMAGEPRLIRRPITVLAERVVVGLDREALGALLKS